MKRQLVEINYYGMTPPNTEEAQAQMMQRKLLRSIGIKFFYDGNSDDNIEYTKYLEKLSRGKLTMYKDYNHYDYEQTQAHLMILDNKNIPEDMLNRLIQTTKELKILEENDRAIRTN